MYVNTHQLEIAVPLLDGYENDSEQEIATVEINDDGTTVKNTLSKCNRIILLYGIITGITLQLAVFGLLDLVTVWLVKGDSAKMLTVQTCAMYVNLRWILCFTTCSTIYYIYSSLLDFGYELSVLRMRLAGKHIDEEKGCDDLKDEIDDNIDVYFAIGNLVSILISCQHFSE